MNDINNYETFTEDDFLKPEVMLKLYSYGAFPMAQDKNSEIQWYMPKIRCVIPIEQFNFPRSLRKFYEKSDFRYTIDNNPLAVIKGCANRELTWITSKLINGYEQLWDLGYLHSVEIYQKNTLVGGLYGIAIKGAFFGESMFSTVPQASKCALVKLMEILRKNNFVVLDVQYITEHLKMFGAIEISLKSYQEYLFKAYTSDIDFKFVD